MKTTTAAFNTHLNGEQTTLSTCVKIIQKKYQPRIIAISQTNPIVVQTRWAHGLTTGDAVKFSLIRGMTSLNRNEYTITRLTETTFSIDVDGTVLAAYTHKGIAHKVSGYTDHRSDLVFDGLTYQSALAYMPNATKLGADLSVDSVELRGILQNAAKVELNGGVISAINDEDLAAGRYDDAAVEIFMVNHADLTMGRMALLAGRFGKISLQRGTYTTELETKTAFLQETLQEVYSNVCRADLGDDLDGSEPEHDRQQGFGCKVRLDPPYWQPSTAYTARPAQDAGLGSVIKPTTYNGRQFKCSTAGTSGLSEPSWNTTIGATTVDGTAVWTTIEALTKNGIVYQVIDRRRFIDNDRDEAPIAGIGGASTLFPIIAVSTGAQRFTIAGDFVDEFPAGSRFTVVNSTLNDGTYTIASADLNAGNTRIVVTETVPSGTADGAIVGRLGSMVGFFTYGLITFTRGRNIGISREIKSFSTTTIDGETFTGPGAFEVFEAFPFDINEGDTYEVRAGCDKSLVMCSTKFENVNNRRAEDNIPGNDNMMLYPDSH